MKTKRALIIVDLNNDFMPGGALAVADGDQVIDVINQLMRNEDYDYIVATQDWHPEDHVSFEQWPPHCVAGTTGADYHPQLEMARVHALIRKGFDPHADSYSGFYNEKGETNGLAELLMARGITAVDIVGLAIDYCVRATAIEAATRVGLAARVRLNACRGVGLKPDDIPNALNDMRQAGVELVQH